MARLTNPWTWAAELIDNGYSVQQALRYVAEVSSDFYFDVAAGRVAGHSSVNKFGANTDIPDGGTEIVWSGSGVYTFSTTADITHIVSSAAETQTIEVQGLDANWVLVTQEKDLTGTTGVALDTPLIRVFRMKVNDSTTNAGVVQCGVGAVTSAFTAGDLRAQIDIGLGQTLMAIYTVPAGHTAYVAKYYGSMKGSAPKIPDAVVLRFWAVDRANNYAPQIKHAIGGAITGSSIIDFHLDAPASFSEKTDLYIDATPDGAIADVSAGFDLVLVDDGF